MGYWETKHGARRWRQGSKPVVPGGSAVTGGFSPIDEEGGTDIITQNPYSLGTQTIDTGNIDFSDSEQVKGIQKALGLKTDGIWGSKTEDAYRDYIDARRESQGLMGYIYENEDPDSGFQGDERTRKAILQSPLTEGETVPGRVASNEALNVYKPNVGGQTGMANVNITEPTVRGALQDTMEDYRDLGSNVYNWFANKWKGE